MLPSIPSNAEPQPITLRQLLGYAFTTRAGASLLAFGVLALLVVTVASAGLLWQLRQQALTATESHLSSLGEVLAEQTIRTVQEADLVLRATQERLREDALANVRHDGASLNALLSGRLIGLPQSRHLLVINKEGQLIGHSHITKPQQSFATQESFNRHRLLPRDQLILADPTPQPDGKHWEIALSRPLIGIDGQFAGTAVITLDVRYFQDFYQSIGLGQAASISLVRDDGTILVCQTGKESKVGKKLTVNSPALQALFRKQSSWYGKIYSANSDSPRYLALRHVGNYPLAVSLSVSEDAITEDWRVALKMTITGLLLIAFIIGLFILALLNQQLRRQQAEGQATHNEQQLGASLALQNAILDSTAYGFIATDSDGTIRSVNRRVETMLGYPPDELIGQQKLTLFHDPNEIAVHLDTREYSPDGAWALLTDKARKGQIAESEWTYLRKDGSRLPVMLSVTALQQGTGLVSGFLAIVNDLTERRRVEQMKREFVSTVSHELRTPLTSIRGSLGLLLGGMNNELSEQAVQLIGIAHKNSERLVRLINDILDIEKIESGKMKLEIRAEPVMTLVSQAISINRGFAQEYGIQYKVVESCDNVMAWLDADRFGQIMANLLSNAVKFSPTGQGVEVGVRRAGKRIRIMVRDYGPGIPAQFRSQLFQKFSQVDSSDTRQKGGSGLGLAISKALTEAMQGKLGYEDAEGGGSLFWLELPIADPVT
ncbi:ATP-binding protein [Parachitinimonas caeni]|uniref:histidine kinase n=1 Tax=Parachitinimonas caeni TaxID=3031301 RepID=A0ABT7DRU1_9NEIS|nr:ATP-binding protein [Parachitinimonas caeni]MDK2122771.1 ATP-binding protein [Parachitinimonas caeni]